MPVFLCKIKRSTKGKERPTLPSQQPLQKPALFLLQLPPLLAASGVTTSVTETLIDPRLSKLDAQIMFSLVRRHPFKPGETAPPQNSLVSH